MIARALLLLAAAGWSAATSATEDDSQLLVQTTHGWLRGSYAYTRGGRKINQFLGIHYAKSPTGSLSFQSPVPVDPWDGVKDATVECGKCHQQFTMTESTRYIVEGVPDCLCVNIFCPHREKTEPKNYESAYRSVCNGIKPVLYIKV